MAVLEFDVALFPPAAQGRQIVAASRRKRETWVTFRRDETFLTILLEDQHSIGQNARFLHPLAKAFRYRAKIFADDNAAMPLALQREDTDKIRHRIRDVSALGW